MKDLKIIVSSEAENKEAQELFFKLGYCWAYKNLGKKLLLSKNNVYLFADSDGTLGTGTHQDEVFFNNWFGKEITLQELKDLVVLKRNDPKDANVIQDGDIPCPCDLYLTDNKELYFYHCGKEKWILSNLNGDQDYYNLLKPIKDEVMKEYLTKNSSGNYQLVNHRFSEDDIEVPEGANFYCDRYFWTQLNSKKFWNGDNWQNDFKTLCGFSKSYNKTILWQRYVQPEELPFIDDGITDCREAIQEIYKPTDFGASSLNDQYAEIERVRKQTIEATLAERQAQYGCFEDVARTTGKIMEALSEVRVNGLNDLPYPHRMALYMIASKMARIVNGDFNHKDGWHDIGGYSKLIEDLL